MSAHGFRSLFMAASVAGAALGCYLVSLNVASERAKLEAVESKIVLAQRDIRLLQTEIGTRGRLAQLERWNAGFIRLSAPTADQFLEGGFQLATMVKPAPKPAIDAPVVLASAPADHTMTRPATTSDGEEAKPGQSVRMATPERRAASAEDMMVVAGYRKPEPQRPSIVQPPARPANVIKAATKPPAAKGTKTASADTLAPLPATRPAAKATAPGGASAAGGLPRTKESGTPR